MARWRVAPHDRQLLRRPHIAGLAALIRAKHPELRPFQVKTVLWATGANLREAPGAPQMAGRLSRAMRPVTTSVRATSALAAAGGPRSAV